MGVPGFFLLISENGMSNLSDMQWVVDSVKWILICGAFIFSFYAYHNPRSSRAEGNVSHNVLKDIANGKKDKECALWDYGKFGVSVVPLNDTWQEWIMGLVKTTDRPDLDYHNFGKEFHFWDLANSRKIEIPTGNKVRHEIVGHFLRRGMVLRLMPND